MVTHPYPEARDCSWFYFLPTGQISTHFSSNCLSWCPTHLPAGSTTTSCWTSLIPYTYLDFYLIYHLFIHSTDIQYVSLYHLIWEALEYCSTELAPRYSGPARGKGQITVVRPRRALEERPKSRDTEIIDLPILACLPPLGPVATALKQSPARDASPHLVWPQLAKLHILEVVEWSGCWVCGHILKDYLFISHPA